MYVCLHVRLPFARATALNTASGTIFPFDLKTYARGPSMVLHKDCMFAMNNAKDGRLFASGALDAKCAVWDAVTRLCVSMAVSQLSPCRQAGGCAQRSPERSAPCGVCDQGHADHIERRHNGHSLAHSQLQAAACVQGYGVGLHGAAG